MAADPDYSILSRFEGQITRPKTSVFYHIGLVLVAGTMLLLPLIYVAMVGAVGYAVYYHAVHNWHPIMDLGGFHGGGRVVIFKFLVYFTPLAAGIVVVFFMFRVGDDLEKTLKVGLAPLAQRLNRKMDRCNGPADLVRCDRQEFVSRVKSSRLTSRGLGSSIASGGSR